MKKNEKKDRATTKWRYSKEEFARRGDAIYEKKIAPRLKPEGMGKFVAIDIETGAYEIGEDEMAVSDKLHARIPDAQVWMVRAGLGYLHRFGGRQLRNQQEENHGLNETALQQGRVRSAGRGNLRARHPAEAGTNAARRIRAYRY